MGFGEGVSFLASRGRYDTGCTLPVPLMLPGVGQVPAPTA
jgi:hypothetical protein